MISSYTTGKAKEINEEGAAYMFACIAAFFCGIQKVFRSSLIVPAIQAG